MTDTNAENPMVAAMREALKPYQVFPKDQTTLVLINCQKGFLDEQSELKTKLEELLHFARQNHWKIIHAPFGYADRKFPSPAHLLMDEKLKKSEEAKDMLFVEVGDIILPTRSTLSAFAGTGLEKKLRQHGLEHLVLVGPVADLTLDSTMRDGIQNDFHVAILTDVIAMTNQSQRVDHYKETLERYAQTVTTLENLKRLSEKS